MSSIKLRRVGEQRARIPKLIHYNKLDKGGHFAAWEQPQLFADEVRAGFRSLRRPSYREGSAHAPSERRSNVSHGGEPPESAAARARQATSWSRSGAFRTPPVSAWEAVGVDMDARGYIRVNDRLETTAPMSGLLAIVPAARSSRTIGR